MQPHKPRRKPRSRLLAKLPPVPAVEAEIKQLSGQVRVLLDLLDVCRQAGSSERPASPSPSAKD